MNVESQVAAVIAGQVAILVLGWRFVLWVRGLIRTELAPFAKRLDRVERAVEGLPCAHPGCPLHDPGAHPAPADGG